MNPNDLKMFELALKLDTITAELQTKVACIVAAIGSQKQPENV